MLLKKSGAWYTYDEERLGQGREAAKKTLKENPDVREEIEAKVRDYYSIDGKQNIQEIVEEVIEPAKAEKVAEKPEKEPQTK